MARQHHSFYGTKTTFWLISVEKFIKNFIFFLCLIWLFSFRNSTLTQSLEGSYSNTRVSYFPMVLPDSVPLNISWLGLSTVLALHLSIRHLIKLSAIRWCESHLGKLYKWCHENLNNFLHCSPLCDTKIVT
jgi:hypothetical protein